MFTQETTQNFSDYEVALGELEKRMPGEIELEGNNLADIDIELNGNALSEIDGENNVIMTFDLKNIIKEELAKT